VEENVIEGVSAIWCWKPIDECDIVKQNSPKCGTSKLYSRQSLFEHLDDEVEMQLPAQLA
jgi:hypothetical protein